ncbi:MAG TPA: methionyl-tRNA formyltransferase [Allosphingosinicella sp.]|nr:methionyl-tRNA formyltransferase [Allosphingosinicella sp.]
MASEQRFVVATPHDRFDPVEQRLRAAGLDLVRVRDPEALTAAALAGIAPRYVFFPHWSWKIPGEVYERFECIIFHMTDVPYGRGGSPLQNLIVRGHDATMMTALRCVAEMDAGPVYLKRPLTLAGTAEDILRRAGELIGDMIVELARTHPEPREQEGEVTAFKRRKPADGALGGAASLKEAYDLIRMLDADGYPRAFAEIGPFRLEFDRADLQAGALEARVRISPREKEA